ncbi:hypothetical protein CEUSTIGMA_g5559.t1 [Chlamydomonas eustigma]|uniref:Uncharacterized protein n=1 Tax=Chlamydomonas eustigma TaxID=1157962 RepID=A0A250X4V2_9CHLO|nr:hypothetical protein CEUSTIGMA_g5559.t1 [Chlamydomonas eustigma]|eukprot:GAX78117.1 hypothetical protein CEUSTIGMA_g5559.t1 [Chlamydomonas eustigma]
MLVQHAQRCDRVGLLYKPPSIASSSNISLRSSSKSFSTGPISGDKEEKTPVQQRILNGILGISNVPYSSYVPSPETFLHRVDARVKQLWLVAVYFMVARSSPVVRVCIAGAVALASVAVLPPRLWRSQLTRLGILCSVLMMMTALFSDGLPPVLQPRDPPPLIYSEPGLPPLQPTGYNYVVLHVWFITITQRSINLALTVGALTFTALQSASLCLVTTPGEEMAEGLRWWLSPLKSLGVPVQEIALTLLLSLRFMSLVFEEVRNLCLGLASRGVDWAAHGNGGSLQLLGRLSARLFGNLFHRSENIAQAMVARGFTGPADHSMYMTRINRPSWVANLLTIMLLFFFLFISQRYR